MKVVWMINLQMYVVLLFNLQKQWFYPLKIHSPKTSRHQKVQKEIAKVIHMNQNLFIIERELGSLEDLDLSLPNN